ncbi:hypothetical protein ACOQFO_04270 [Ureibacillus sp. MALMAid1270]|uniref:hypothetical protein n=1 Tax=Ureibacillus sp. MALMAid1270 TaxID=3411629 RepID=UPI003BA4C71D
MKRVIVLKKKHKVLISISIILNIVLISIVIISVIHMNDITERTFKTNAINKLFELHKTLSKLENENWSDLDLLSIQLEDASSSTAHALNIGVTSKTIKTMNQDDYEMLELGALLKRYSFITNPDFSAENVEKMKLELIRFNTILAENGFDNEEAIGSWTKQDYLKKVRNIVSELEKE